MVSIVRNNGKLRFMLDEKTLKAHNFVESLRSLTNIYKKTIFLILDNLTVHYSKKVFESVKCHKSKIVLFCTTLHTTIQSR